MGAGQAGLQLGIGLLDAGYEVKIVSNRTPEEIYNGRVSSSQCMFGTALAREHVLGIDFWSQRCPNIREMSLSVTDGNGGKGISWSSLLDLPAQSVDQRLKIPRWIAEFVRRGGTLEIRDATIDDLEEYRRDADLVVVAAGKGSIANLFERDIERSLYVNPQRALALTYVTGMAPRTSNSAISFNLVPGVGELIVFPALTTTGPCEIMLLEGLPGGPMDCFRGVTDPQQHLEVTKRVVGEYFPWEAERCGDAQLTDDLGVLAGRFAPTVRRPVGMLPSGASVLGMADVVVLNDPLTGQGSNNASKCAASYLSSILEHADRPFDERFMSETFERYWDYTRYVVDWTNTLLGPTPWHVLQLVRAAGSNPRIARRFANGFDDPRDFFLWFMEATSARTYLDEFPTVA
ncbi:styrene monooxygenase/indole monooxygenase family protein [Nocardia sp. NPDC049190]|uniref:styrene monooxygenase/indole monooxygenase family protein n=1 Tax=Nocardia sp. NPDC049190 TaxID=3155650 RepID=UPI0033D2622B